MRNRSAPNPSLLPSPGWLFLIAGLAILGSAVLIPASEALDEARYARDRALVSEQFRLDRIARRVEESPEQLVVGDPLPYE